jgi:hypothetical protein
VGAVAAAISPPQQRVGSYRLGKRLGQGGQGTAFEAVRDDGTCHQRIAIKLVKWEIDSQTARTQFRDLAGQLFHTRILVLCGDRDGAAGAGESARPQKAVRGRGSAGSAQVVVSLQ